MPAGRQDTMPTTTLIHTETLQLAEMQTVEIAKALAHQAKVIIMGDLNDDPGDESLVNQEDFRYHGPTPQSRETGILMLADGCEARVRAESPADEEELRDIIKRAISDRLARGQLDNTSLTLYDLNQIADSFTTTLRSIYHPRLKYPTLDAKTQPTPLKQAPAESPLPAYPVQIKEESETR